jgi:hypothetical protein
LTARCDCGYAKRWLAFGEGMARFREHCQVPARCDECHEVVVVDYLFPKIADPDQSGRASFSCEACDEEVEVYAEFRRGDAEGWPEGESWAVPGGHLILPMTSNVCPRCGAPNLSFEEAGVFD